MKFQDFPFEVDTPGTIRREPGPGVYLPGIDNIIVTILGSEVVVKVHIQSGLCLRYEFGGKMYEVASPPEEALFTIKDGVMTPSVQGEEIEASFLKPFFQVAVGGFGSESCLELRME